MAYKDEQPFERDSFVFFRSHYDAIIKLPREEQLSVLLAICQLGLYGAVTEPLDGIADAVFTAVRYSIESGYRKALNGHRGGRPKAAGKQTESETEADGKQAESYRIEKNRREEKENRRECGSPAPPRFRIPTVEEVRAYCQQRHNSVDPGHFVDYYQARGWELNGGRRMKDWKAALRTWEKRERPSNAPEQKGGGRDECGGTVSKGGRHLPGETVL